MTKYSSEDALREFDVLPRNQSFSLVVQEDVFTILHLAALQMDSCIYAEPLPHSIYAHAKPLPPPQLVLSQVLRSYHCVQCRMQKNDKQPLNKATLINSHP